MYIYINININDSIILFTFYFYFLIHLFIYSFYPPPKKKGSDHPAVRIYDVKSFQCYIPPNPNDYHRARINQVK